MFSVNAGKTEELFRSFVYASNTRKERKSLWEDLRNHNEAPIFKSKKWIIMRDYNEILDGGEHSEFEVSPRIPLGMQEFQEIMRNCKLKDMGYEGPLFTWCNKREEGLIFNKLDRVFVKEKCIAHKHIVYLNQEDVLTI